VVVEEIARWRASEQYVLAVVSAFGSTTEELFKRAGRYGEPTNEEGWHDWWLLERNSRLR
jgi:hypothetical protein